MGQLNFNLPEIDREETKKNVEAALEKYQIYLLMDPSEIAPKITSSFKITPPSNNNQFHSSTESTAIDRIDKEAERNEYIDKIRKAVNRLAYKERSIIIKRYMEDEDTLDYLTYNELGLSERHYYRVKSRAFYKLAFILRIEVYKEGESA
ncbi:ArpU family transcriptional regulator [Halobacillus litoralis]|uniref:ArpU family transcriptional regulator n=1 Tax=Halobacillus litoralis TaxID=45668 RepID=A0A845EF00_9BACI|nr:ArpU family phage packaging/lysis transcriptional regulator [Halobacillus litoralis]MYL50271.1 ArpU family transcriptional regulator [Halobacillus litoralis]